MSRVLKASEARFLFNIAGKKLGVIDFSAREEISYPYHVVLTLATEDDIGFDDVIGKEALLTILGEDTDRYFHGIINQFMQTGSRGRFLLYQATVVPYLWLLSLEQDCRIFQNKSIEDIIKTVLTDTGIPADRFEFRLQGSYPEREYCVQYRETDLNFISRLLEEEGIYYFFEHEEDSHILIFGDSTVNYKPINSEIDIEFHPQDSMASDKEVVNRLIASRQIQTGKVTMRDFNFIKPSLDLTVQQEANNSGNIEKKLEMYDYPGEYMDHERGKKLAEVRLQETVMFRDKIEGQGNCCRFIPGFTFKLIHHERESINQEYLLVEILHSGSQSGTLEETGGGGLSYSNQFMGIPSSVTFKPERRVPKPVVEGVQTAIVTGPSGEEIYTDEHGRVKIQFHWDRLGSKDDKSSCWIRVSQAWAGAGWGAMHIPRIGQEVIVDFIEGDPDRPIITGRVYHGTNTPPYSLPADKTRSTIKSDTSPGGGGSNELRFEDKKGSEEVYLHGQKDWTIVIDNDKNQTIGNDENLTVGNNKTITIGVNHTESIGANMSLTVGSNKSETVSVASTENVGAAKALSIGAAYQVSVAAAMNETVGGVKAEEIGAAKTVSVGAHSNENIGGGKSENIGGDKSEKIGGSKSVNSGSNISESAKNDVSVQSGKKMLLSSGDDLGIKGDKKGVIEIKDQLTIKVGKASIIMEKNGDITIKGNKINIKGSGDIVMKGKNILAN